MWPDHVWILWCQHPKTTTQIDRSLLFRHPTELIRPMAPQFVVPWHPKDFGEPFSCPPQSELEVAQSLANITSQDQPVVRPSSSGNECLTVGTIS